MKKNSAQNRNEGPKVPDYARIQLIMAALAVVVVFALTVVAGAAAAEIAQGGVPVSTTPA